VCEAILEEGFEPTNSQSCVTRASYITYTTSLADKIGLSNTKVLQCTNTFQLTWK